MERKTDPQEKGVKVDITLQESVERLMEASLKIDRIDTELDDWVSDALYGDPKWRDAALNVRHATGALLAARQLVSLAWQELKQLQKSDG